MPPLHRRLRLLIGLAVLTFAARTAAQSPGAVARVVDDDTRSPLAGVIVVLQPAAGGQARETVTDRAGRFVFTGVAHGDYVVTAALDGFQSGKAAVSVGDEAPP